MGLSTSLNTAIGGLNAAQVGIGVVSQNVANAGTTGYVRRTVSTADSLTGHTIGVQSTQVQRLLDKIVQHQLWQEASGAAYTSTRASALSNLDKLYGAPGSSTALDTIFNKFTGALQSLQNDPSSYSLRSQVIDNATQLARQLNTLSNGVQALRSQAESSIASAVGKVNDLLGALSKVNTRIVGSPNDGATAALKDQRDLILSELSQYVDIKTTEDARGSVSVVTGSGTQLFDGTAAVTFKFDEHSGLGPDNQWSTDPTQRGVGTIKIIDASGNASDAIANRIFRSGEIAANIELRDKTLVQAQAQLDEIAAQMAKALSEHSLQSTAYPAGSPTPTGRELDLGFDPAKQRLNTLTFDYAPTPPGPARHFTFVNAPAGATLPPSSEPNTTVIAIDFSAGPAVVASQIQSALNANGATGFAVTNTGSVLQITEPSGRVSGLSAKTSALTADAPTTGMPLFVDADNKPFFASYDEATRKTGLAARISVNADVINDRSLLVGPAGTAAGDTTRPKALLASLTSSVRSFDNRSSPDGATAPFSGTITNFVQRVVSSQGQAVEAAKRLDEGQQVALASIQSRFQTTAQVNVDQEMSMLIELQTAYAANARIISTMKEMMDVLMRV
ncbi:MAG: flagellar hook-associated protein FlgK [Bosea sp.]|uniref:flagellar hook-associated protein FlgK n=1 Tax=Bosea sp. (in: a-proteobacteria) TaxID=1871050 RepID=UPI001AD5E8B9|nr:flagellar hook-associated protein FlgK [Bosea sp. (in: a-proteobacteria)]MBN9451032.1 flagellar hook-associated protein FlgK [Bosea sp. (in: a-proteobacteria)]